MTMKCALKPRFYVRDIKKEEIEELLNGYNSYIVTIWKNNIKKEEDIIDAYKDPWSGVLVVIFDDSWCFMELSLKAVRIKHGNGMRKTGDKFLSRITQKIGDKITRISVERFLRVKDGIGKAVINVKLQAITEEGIAYEDGQGVEFY